MTKYDMRFKEFLILEGGNSGDSGSDWFYGNSVYPSDAFDWKYAVTDPSNFVFLQARWKKERDEWGRKFYNINVQDTINKKYVALKSNTMPPASDIKWKHTSKERPNFEVKNNAKIELIGHCKSAKVVNILWKTNDLIDKTDELNRIFGKFEPSHNELPTNFDKPWSSYSGEVKMKHSKKKKYAKHLNNF